MVSTQEDSHALTTACNQMMKITLIRMMMMMTIVTIGFTTQVAQKIGTCFVHINFTKY